jgi:ribosomal protein S18 acetylase RimI-like enzyme
VVSVDQVAWQPAGLADVPALATLWAQAVARRAGMDLPARPDDSLAGLLRDRLTVPGAVPVLGRIADEPVACGLGTPLVLPDASPTTPRAAHVSLLAVTPARWGQGLGRAVLLRLETVLREAGYERAELHVLTANTRARGLYETASWVLLREDPPHLDGPQLVYGKDLLRTPG